MNCPKCKGAMWDNRVDKKTAKSPDWKCKDKQCGHAVWEDKEPAKKVQQAAPAPAPAPSNRMNAAFALYDECFAHALSLTSEAKGYGVQVDTAAIAATLYIQANK